MNRRLPLDDRAATCAAFLQGVDDKDLADLYDDETRWGYVLREIQQQAAFKRRMDGCRNGERLSEGTFEIVK